MSDDEPKSALELAMERLRKKDSDEGVTRQALTEAQKAAIAEARNLCEARLAEREVMHRSAMAKTAEPEARTLLEKEYVRDRERLIGERDAKIERIRRSS
jgi:hypothetical protein